MRALMLAIGCLGIAALGACRAPAIRMAGPLPMGNEIVRDQLFVHCDFTLSERHRLIDELAQLRGVLLKKLDLPPSGEPIHVYLFDNDTQYYDFVGERFPDFSARRALFVETDTRLTVYAHWGDRVAEDLRHEVTHGYLHSVVPHLPLWLDEGLAEYFEVGRSGRRVNVPHVRRLLDPDQRPGQPTNWQPNLARLEALQSAGDMTQQDYAESWAWVHFLLETDPQRRRLLVQYLADLRESDSPGKLESRLAKLLAHPDLALVEHVESLR